MCLQELELGLRVALSMGAVVGLKTLIAKNYRSIILIEFIEDVFNAIMSVDQK